MRCNVVKVKGHHVSTSTIIIVDFLSLECSPVKDVDLSVYNSALFPVFFFFFGRCMKNPAVAVRPQFDYLGGHTQQTGKVKAMARTGLESLPV